MSLLEEIEMSLEELVELREKHHRERSEDPSFRRGDQHYERGLADAYKFVLKVIRKEV